MYIATINMLDDQTQVLDFIRQNGFGILINQTSGKLWATHIPLVLDTNEKGKSVLSGHISIANPQWKSFSNGEDVLAIFSGPHAYISSSWYDHENVPTWNYIAVHVYGKIHILQGEEVIDALKKMVNKYEQGNKHPVTVEGMSAPFLKSQLKGIACFEIEITEMQAAYKLSQNRDDKNYAQIVTELEKRDDPQSHAIAHEMKKQHKT